MKILSIQVLIVLFLSACSSTDTVGEAPETVGRDMNYSGSDCILIRTVRDYSPLDDQHLLIHGPAKRTYFVTLFRPTFEMRGAYRLSFDSRDGQLCPYGGDSIVFGGFSNERVRVRSISRITADQEEQLLIRYGKKEPAETEIPAKPADVKGAEVEELG